MWIKSYRCSDQRHNKIRKLFPVYEGPFRVRVRVYENVYEIERLTSESLGVHNSRQLRPHRIPTWRPVERVIPATQDETQNLTDTDSPSSRDVESQYLAETTETADTEPGPSKGRTRRERGTALSVLALKLETDSDDSYEYYKQPRRSVKFVNNVESPPGSDDIWEIIRRPKRYKRYRNVEKGGSGLPKNKKTSA